MNFLNLCAVDVSNHVIPCCEGCPVHYRGFSKVPGLCPLGAIHSHFPRSSHDNQKMSLVIDKYLPPPGGGELIPAVNHWCAVLTGIYLVLSVFKALLETHYIYDLIELLK